MSIELMLLNYLSYRLIAFLRSRAGDDRGEVTEKVIITAVFAALAIGVGAIIVTKVTAKANGIPTE